MYNHQVAQALSIQPRYRTLVRGLIPIDAQDAYWERCYSPEEAIEVYIYPCPPPGDIAIDPAKIDEILATPEIAPSLREWTTLSRVVGELLTEPQQTLGEDILKHIDGGEETRH
jgi:hypothetical protein